MSAPEHRTPTMCGVCGRVGRFSFAEQAWLHDSLTSENPDHVMVPVAIAEAPAQLRAKCDFCSAPDPAFELPAGNFLFPGSLTHWSRGDWATCAACAELLRADRWDALTDAAVAAQTPADANREARRLYKVAMAELYRRLRAAVTGPVRPIDMTATLPAMPWEG